MLTANALASLPPQAGVDHASHHNRSLLIAEMRDTARLSRRLKIKEHWYNGAPNKATGCARTGRYSRVSDACLPAYHGEFPILAEGMSAPFVTTTGKIRNHRQSNTRRVLTNVHGLNYALNWLDNHCQ